mmetsp:Transcript_26533/g.62923  ORF Transcript_26533/g.62923 Transcript_26533/m.62923 type:complete len:192 (+) Transcript_26533:94-669(+)
MKFLYRHSAVSKIVALAAVALLFKQQGSASVASGTSVPSSTANNTVSEYQPRRKGLGKIVDWGLAKVEAVFDPVNVAELITTFIAKADRMVQIMIHGFFEITSSYQTLHDGEVQRLDQFDTEFADLVKLRNKIERKCLVAGTEERSLCVNKEIEIHEQIQDLRSRRLKSIANVERYKEMIEWCASYENWFC